MGAKGDPTNQSGNAPSGGWAWPANSRKIHKFKDARSLCGRWGYAFTTGQLNEPAAEDACAECKRRSDKEARRG